MEPNQIVPAAELSDEDWNVLRDAVERVEKAHKSGCTPKLESLVDHLHPSLRVRVLMETIKVDQEFLWRRGEHPMMQDYFLRWPELENIPFVRRELVEAECLTRAMFGDPPNVEEIRLLYGELADRIDLGRVASQAACDVAVRPSRIEPEQELSPSTTANYTACESALGEVLMPGTHLDQYVTGKCLGQGGMGVVYLAHDEQLDRQVAIKVPHARGSDEQLERFLKEAKAVARLKHPGIVQVHHFGQQPDGGCYFAMEYIEGCSLANHIAIERPAYSETADLLAKVADAIHHAHREGFVHRDLKPSNILLDREGQPRVVDFGLAMHESIQREQPRDSAGTPTYMSPEQIRGESHRLDGRTDIWAIGVILYEMLTGRKPFEGKNREKVQDEILHRQPKPPRQIVDDIPKDLERVCLRCLQKEEALRYPTAADLAGDLRRSLAPHRRFFIGFAAISAAVVVLLVAVLMSVSRQPSLDETVSSPLASLSGTVDVWVWNANDSARRRLTLHDSGTLPLRPGDQIRLEVNLNRPAYAYVLLIDSEGSVAPIYPWSPGDWSKFPALQTPVDRLSLPESVDEGWPVTPPYGVESFVLLAREEPLPRDVDIQALLVGLPHQKVHDFGRAIWFADGTPLSPAVDRLRGIDIAGGTPIDDSLLTTHRVIQDNLNPLFVLSRAVSFASRGEQEEP